MITQPHRAQTGGRRYRHLFEHAPICIFVIDLTANPATILDVNRRAEVVYGYTTEELVCMPAIHLVPEEAMLDILTIVQKVQQGQRVKTETTSRRRDGTPFPVRVIAAPDPTDGGQMIVTVEDITAEIQRRTEAEAIDAERLRIAREIHDTVAQSLAGIRLKSELWNHLPNSAPPEMRAALEELQAVLLTAINDLRRVIFALRPADLETLGFFPSLNQLIRDFGEYNQLMTQFEVSGVIENLPMAYELPLYRIIQEGLNNIHRHAHASSVLVSFTLDAAGIIVSIRDNGYGFDPTLGGRLVHSGHFGLQQMRERILELGGTLDIHSAVGQGTELLITLPPLTKEVNYASD